MSLKSLSYKHTKTIIFIIISIAFLLFSIIVFNSYNKRIKYSEKRLAYLSNKYILLSNNYPLKINSDIKVLNSDGNEYKLNDLINSDSEVIIFRYFHNGCESCNIEEIINIKNSIKNIDRKFFILCSFEDFKSFISFSKVYKINDIALFLQDGVFNYSYFENNFIPYYVRYIKSQYISSFVPNKEFPELSEGWLN